MRKQITTNYKFKKKPTIAINITKSRKITTLLLINLQTAVKTSIVLKIYRNKLPCEHIGRAPPRALEGAHANEGPCSLSFISVTTFSHLVFYKILTYHLSTHFGG
jgi:hypothetical protein